VTVGLVSRQALPSRTSIAVIALVMAAYGAVFAHVPWPHTDLANALQQAEDLTWGRTIGGAFGGGVEYRPIMIVATKAAYEIIGLHLWVYKTLVLLEFAAVLWLLLVLWQPAGWRRITAALVALACVVGLHSSRVLFLFLPLNGGTISIFLILFAVLLIVEPAGRQWEWWFIPLTLGAVLLVEYGALIVPLVLAGWWLRAPGVSWRAALATLAGFSLYVLLRRSLGTSVGWAVYTETGLGFDDVRPEQITAIFAHAPWLFWLHNVAVSILTVVLSEPRAGKFKFVSAVLRGQAFDWQWLHVLSSLATTAVVIGVMAGRGLLPPRDRLIATLGAVLLFAGSALGFLYTRDRIALPSGFGYAMIVYVAVAALLERTSWPGPRAILAIVLVAALAVCWSWRSVEAAVVLRDRAWSYYLEWTTRYHIDGDETPLLRNLRLRVISHRPPDPRRDPAWTYRWFEREFDRLPD